MGERKPFIPGFATEADAIKAGTKFYQRTNGQLGRYGRDFFLIQNEQGRWHFVGAASQPAPAGSSEGER